MKYKGVQVGCTEIEIKTRSLSLYTEMRDWCTQQFGKSGNYADDTWTSRETVHMNYTMFYFENPKDATLFALRWA